MKKYLIAAGQTIGMILGGVCIGLLLGYLLTLNPTISVIILSAGLVSIIAFSIYWRAQMIGDQ